jgi:hypothetical protein
MGAFVLWTNRAWLVSKIIVIRDFFARLLKSTFRRRNVRSLENKDDTEAAAAPGTPPTGLILLIAKARRRNDDH